MKSFFPALALFLGLACVASAENGRPGEFDYYVLALSWSPSWCAETGDARGAGQCARSSGLGFTLHGLWPQYETGWPEYCRTNTGDPNRRQSASMADIMGDGGLAWHQWKKHGRCSGLSAAGYYDLSRRAYLSVDRPPVLRKLPKSLIVDPKVIEQAFLERNPEFRPDGVTVTCKGGRIAEVRICLTKGLTPRACGANSRTDCSHPAEISPIR